MSVSSSSDDDDDDETKMDCRYSIRLLGPVEMVSFADRLFIVDSAAIAEEEHK